MTEGAAQLETAAIGGRTWVSAESLADLFEQMRNDAGDGPVKTSFATLTETFRSISSYADLTAEAASDDSKIQARRCQCGAVVIDGRSIGGDPIVVNALPDDAGQLFPMKVREGVPTLVPWRAGLDGIDVVRLTRHECGTPPPAPECPDCACNRVEGHPGSHLMRCTKSDQCTEPAGHRGRCLPPGPRPDFSAGGVRWSVSDE